MPKQDTLTLLRDLENDFGLGNPLFSSRLHHMGDTIAGFRSYAAGVSFFKKSERNQMLHDRLEWMRKQCENGALQKGRTMEELVNEARRKIPCRAYAKCKNHISDSSCRQDAG